MTDKSLYENNPLHGLKLDTLVEELVNHYGFKILFAATNLNCFKTKPSVASAIKFLKKTEWAREKLEDFYLYEFKSLPKPRLEEFDISPRTRIIPSDQTPGEPNELTVEELEEQKQRRVENYEQKRASKANKRFGGQPKQERDYDRKPVKKDVPSDPWANFKKSN